MNLRCNIDDLQFRPAMKRFFAGRDCLYLWRGIYLVCGRGGRIVSFIGRKNSPAGHQVKADDLQGSWGRWIWWCWFASAVPLPLLEHREGWHLAICVSAYPALDLPCCLLRPDCSSSTSAFKSFFAISRRVGSLICVILSFISSTHSSVSGSAGNMPAARKTRTGGSLNARAIWRRDFSSGIRPAI